MGVHSIQMAVNNVFIVGKKEKNSTVVEQVLSIFVFSRALTFHRLAEQLYVGIHYLQMAVNEQQQTVNDVFIEGKKKNRTVVEQVLSIFIFSRALIFDRSVEQLSNGHKCCRVGP